MVTIKCALLPASNLKAAASIDFRESTKMRVLLKWKIWKIERCIKKLLVSRKIKPKVWSFGAYYIDPKYLLFVVGVSSDIEKYKLKSNIEFLSELRELLNVYNWPLSAREEVIFDIESQETVDRENNGNWWYHYK